jgi:hypothetical protein
MKASILSAVAVLAVTFAFSASASEKNSSPLPGSEAAAQDAGLGVDTTEIQRLGGVCSSTLEGCMENAVVVNLLSTAAVQFSAVCLGAHYDVCSYSHPYYLRTNMILVNRR